MYDSVDLILLPVDAVIAICEKLKGFYHSSRKDALALCAAERQDYTRNFGRLPFGRVGPLELRCESSYSCGIGLRLQERLARTDPQQPYHP